MTMETSPVIETVTAPVPEPVIVVPEPAPTVSITEHSHDEYVRHDAYFERVTNLENRLVEQDLRIAELERKPSESEMLENAREAALTEVAIIGDIVADVVTAPSNPPVVIPEPEPEPEPEPVIVAEPEPEPVATIPEPDVIVNRPQARRRRRTGIW